MSSIFPAAWSGSDQISSVIAAASLIPASLGTLGLLWFSLATTPVIDEATGTLLSLAGLTSIPVLVFSTWLLARRIGLLHFRLIALTLGTVGLGAWPVAQALSHASL
jgi:hypothetical protein